MSNNEEKIDFVLIWVDGSDPKWLEEKAKYSDDPNSVLNKVNRYRDWGLLKYWFRGVEKFAPWVNNVYFITCGHYPEWLNIDNPKLKFLKHDDYIPKEYLPTFNANPIELNFHRITDLSERFVYFNDDTFITKYLEKKDLFENNKPKYIACNDIISSNEYDDIFPRILINDISFINKYFNKKEVMKKNFSKWFHFNYDWKIWMKNISLLPFYYFSSIYNPHLPTPLLKSTMEELWSLEKDVFVKTSCNKFRSKNDVNQYIFKWYDIARGNFEPGKKLGMYFNILEDNKYLHEAIQNQKYKMICISDDENIDFEKTKKEVINSFEKILPDKCSFEK